jgi:hypothetical protein
MEIANRQSSWCEYLSKVPLYKAHVAKVCFRGDYGCGLVATISGSCSGIVLLVATISGSGSGASYNMATISCTNSGGFSVNI